MGKMFFKAVWRRVGVEKRTWAYGFAKGRAREGAIMVQEIMRYRLRRMGAGVVVTTFRDVANAFPSPTWEALDRMTRRAVDKGEGTRGREEEYLKLLKVRYRESLMRIYVGGGEGEEVVVAPRCGGLQGDTIMAEGFACMYNVMMDEYLARKDGRGRVVWGLDPWG